MTFCATASSVRRCFSASDPSHQTMRSGFVRRAISSTQASRWGFCVRGFPAESVGVDGWVVMVSLVGQRRYRPRHSR